MLRTSIYAVGVLAIAASATAQKQTLRSFQRITVPIKDAGTYHVATGTWTRPAAEAPSSSALVGGTMDTIYACTTNSGYFAALDPGHIWTASGRIPSTGSPNQLWNSAALPDGSQGGSATGCQNSYQVDLFTVAYCTDQAGPTVAMTVAFFQSWTPPCTTSLLAATPQGGPFPLAGLPGRGTGVQGCWLVQIDLAAVTSSFSMQADGDGVYSLGTDDGFGWTFTFPSITSTLAGTGPILAGAPSDATGPGTACQPPHPGIGWLQFPPAISDEAAGYDGRRFDTVAGACVPMWPANGSSFAYPGPKDPNRELGSDMLNDDAFRIEGGAAPAPGCYFFGGPASGAPPNGPYGNYFLELKAKVSCAPPPLGTGFCFGDGLNPTPSTPCPCGNFGAANNGCASSFNNAGANLAGSGTTSPDTAVLTITGTNLNPGIVVFTANTAEVPDGAQFGDGITCGGGQLGRLRGVATVGGAASFPVPPETILLSVRTSNLLYGGAPLPGSGTSVVYGCFYRNAAAAFCPPFTFNGPNNYRIVW